MNSNQYPQAKAYAIDHKKNNILFAATALIIGLAVMAILGGQAHADTQPDVKPPYELKSQKLNH